MKHQAGRQTTPERRQSSRSRHQFQTSTRIQTLSMTRRSGDFRQKFLGLQGQTLAAADVQLVGAKILRGLAHARRPVMRKKSQNEPPKHK